MSLYQHDGDGKIFKILNGKVVWICECIIDNAQGVVDILNSAQKELEEVKSYNTGIPKLPSLEECHREVQSHVWGGKFVAKSSNITEIVYEFIVRQLQAGPKS